MEHSTATVNSRQSTVDKDNDASLGKSFPLWNDPTKNRKPSVTTGNESVNGTLLPSRHRYPRLVEPYRPGIIRRLLLALGIIKAPKASSCVPNWHFSNVDTTGQLVTFHCAKDGEPYGVVHEIPPEHQSPPIIHV